MIDELRSLDHDQLRRLTGLLTDDVEVLTADGDRVPQLLVEVLRDRLGIPEKDGSHDDLGVYLRKRLVEVARDDFACVADTDLLTDTELAMAIIDYVLQAASSVDGSDEEGPFATYFRTKSARQRAAWVSASADLAAATADAAVTPDELDDGPSGTAQTVLANLAAVAGPAAIRQAGVSRAVGLGAVAATPLAATGAALFLAGIAGFSFGVLGDLEDKARRSRRARRSARVQAVIILAAFILAEADTVDVDEERLGGW